MKYFIFSFFLLMICMAPLSGQLDEQAVVEEEVSAANSNMWQTLAKITYKKEYNDLMGFKIDVPVFSDGIQSLEGQEIEIRGYIVPVEGYKGHKEFVLSAYPYNMCFFCGGAGPETVMEVYSNDEVKYTTEPITLRGKLELNADDINRLIYALNDANLVEE